MDSDISVKISKEWGVTEETISKYSAFFSNVIKPVIRSNYLSHLVTTVENMVNDKRIKDFLAKIEGGNVDFKNLLGSRTFRLYSIMIVPIDLKRRATTRYHPSGAIIYYNSCYEEKIKRILIAHEIGHIVNKELMKDSSDSEQTANLFAFIAMDDKNKFYTEECKKFVSKSDLEIFDDIKNICPI
jgi:hypothetical protein